MRRTAGVGLAILCVATGCAAIPVQETTLRNAHGGTVTCKQVGRGIVLLRRWESRSMRTAWRRPAPTATNEVKT